MCAVPMCSTGRELSGSGISDPGHLRQEHWHCPSFILCPVVALTFSWGEVNGLLLTADRAPTTGNVTIPQESGLVTFHLLGLQEYG